MSGAIPLHAFMRWTRTALPLPLPLIFLSYFLDLPCKEFCCVFNLRSLKRCEHATRSVNAFSAAVQKQTEQTGQKYKPALQRKEQTCLNSFQSTPCFVELAQPTNTMEPTLQCCVLIGKPIFEANSTVNAAPSSIVNPL